ncbi:peptidoglycan-recognition protein LB [Anabrus simplex]|uniref:peptidoglycan-recognition protein LB n=1 Tax=Anabrus simplex TaxID=316456 RepID=UPI0034DD18AC
MASDKCLEIVTREQWAALPPKETDPLTVPVPYVVIHHTHSPKYSSSSEQCEEDMRKIQLFHQYVRNWSDIGYNFCIGGDGRAYEGRGWTILGAHAYHYNKKSIGIAFIGDYSTEVPTPIMMSVGQELIACGVQKGMISPDYKLLGHRQVRNTECPGQAFYDVIQTWPHWDPMTDIQ